MSLIVKSIPGFERVSTKLRTESEEIDIVIPNESSEPLWQRQGDYILGECKHWSKKVDPKEFSHFFVKLKRRNGRSKLGFFIS